MIDPTRDPRIAPRDETSIPPAAHDAFDDTREILLAQRRRRLGRWVAFAVGLSSAICVVALVRATMAHADAEREDVVVASPATTIASAIAPVAAPPAAHPDAGAAVTPDELPKAAPHKPRPTKRTRHGAR